MALHGIGKQQARSDKHEHDGGQQACQQPPDQ
jgi:hypothetical protein